MKLTESYIDWYTNAPEDDRGSAANHHVWALSTLSIFNRTLISIEILLGKRFCMWVSKNQDIENNKSLIYRLKCYSWLKEVHSSFHKQEISDTHYVGITDAILRSNDYSQISFDGELHICQKQHKDMMSYNKSKEGKQ